MANYSASSAAGGNGCRLDWSLDFDDTANTVTVTATHTHFDGSAAPDPQQAELTFTLNSGQSVGVDLLTGLLSTGGAFVQGQPGTMINVGARTRTNVRLTVSAARSKLITFSTAYLAPA